jgi:hypothetical protein
LHCSASYFFHFWEFTTMRTTSNPSRLPPELLNSLEEDLWQANNAPGINSATRSLQMLGIAAQPPIPTAVRHPEVMPDPYQPQLLAPPPKLSRDEAAMELANRFLADPELFMNMARMYGPGTAGAPVASPTTYSTDVWERCIHIGAISLIAGFALLFSMQNARQNPTSAQQTQAMMEQMERMNAQTTNLAREVARQKPTNNVCILALDCPKK